MSGNLFKKGELPAQPIKASIALLVQADIMRQFKAANSDAIMLPVGSVGKKPDDDYNGDIDIAVKCSSIDELKKMVENAFPNNETADFKTLRIVSMNHKYTDEHDKSVAVDFIMMDSPAYTAFRYHCPDYRNGESRYKVGTKIMLIGTILNHCDKPEKKGYRTKYLFDPLGLFAEYWNPSTNDVIDELVTTDPQAVVDIMFNNSSIDVCDTVESIWEAIHSSGFKHPERVKAIELAFFVNSYRKGWEEQVHPEDFKLEYWTTEEIKKALAPHTALRRINNLLTAIVER